MSNSVTASVAPVRKQTPTVKEIHSSDGNLVWRVFPEKKRFEYFILAKSSQFSTFGGQIVFENFKNRPKGMYQKGFGVARNGSYFVQELKKRLSSPIQLTIRNGGKNSIRTRNNKSIVVVSYEDFIELQRVHSDLTAVKNKKYRVYLIKKLREMFPRARLIKRGEIKSDSDYSPDSIHDMITSPGFRVTDFSKKDVESIAAILPDYLEKYRDTYRLSQQAQKL